MALYVTILREGAEVEIQAIEIVKMDQKADEDSGLIITTADGDEVDRSEIIAITGEAELAKRLSEMVDPRVALKAAIRAWRAAKPNAPESELRQQLKDTGMPEALIDLALKAEAEAPQGYEDEPDEDWDEDEVEPEPYLPHPYGYGTEPTIEQLYRHDDVVLTSPAQGFQPQPVYAAQPVKPAEPTIEQLFKHWNVVLPD